MKYFGGVEGNEIVYNYGRKLDKCDHKELSQLTYFQKPYSYHNENEFRFVITTENIKEEYLYINLDKHDKVLENIIL